MCARASVRVHALLCGLDTSDWALYDPFDARVGTKVQSPHFIFVVEHPTGRVLFDTGMHREMAVDPVGWLGPVAEEYSIEFAASDHVEQRLASIGLGPTDIDTVVLSHMHFDHAGGLECFRHAEILVQRAELEFALNPPLYQQDSYVRGEFDDDYRWNLIDGDHDLFGDGRLVLISTPGHTPGHQSLMVRLDGQQSIFLLGDCAYSLPKMAQRALPAVYWNPDAVIASWDRVEQLERQYGATLLTSHDPAFRERVRLAPQQWYE